VRDPVELAEAVELANKLVVGGSTAEVVVITAAG